MFNVLVSGNGTAWETDQLMRMEVDRFKQYSDGIEAVSVMLENSDTLKLLEEAPTLLMYERGTEGPSADEVRYGYLRGIRVAGKELVFRFSEIGRFRRNVVNEFADRLGFNKYEQNRTHWAIKDGGIPRAMLERLKRESSSPISSGAAGSPVVDLQSVFTNADSGPPEISEFLIKIARKTVPSFKWVIGAAALFSLAAIVIHWGLNLAVLFLVGGVLLIVAVAFIVLWWISRLSPKTASPMAAFLAWSSLLIVVAALVCVLTSATADWPWSIRTWINQHIGGTPPVGPLARQTAVQALASKRDPRIFAELFNSKFVSVNWSNFDAVLRLDRELGPRLGELYDKTYVKETKENDWSRLTEAERDELTYIRGAIKYISLAVGPLLRAARPAGQNVDLRWAWFGDCDWRGVNLYGADLDTLDMRSCNLKGADLGDVTSFQGMYMYRTAWWEAKRISPELLQYLLLNSPYEPGNTYGPQEYRVSARDYEDSVARLKAGK